MNNFRYLKAHIGRTVKIDRGGPESQEGTLVDLQEDFLVLKGTGDSLYYYQITHLKSISMNSQDGFRGRSHNHKEDLVEGSTFEEVLKNSQYRWVRINRGGPSKTEGVIEKVENDSVTLIKNDEVITLPLFHIRSIVLEVEKDDQT
ncbi:hypothetical protein [Guptibacillus hwajinpoensis]|uniref:Spore coat protein n=1 Tax=Guptibacillus hwajinpoensis TaxID=208199 RepID=A0A0J6CT09_9BACL|nr:hypothetical protein [Alkalihalobacillus macyae]KMM39451.1 hypothetical protein AB986_09735 [Alkalihalobacillus macyae]